MKLKLCDEVSKRKFVVYSTFFVKSLTELMASTTSLNPIANALKVGAKKPKAAIGIAIIL